MLPNKGLVDALYERMFGSSEEEGTSNSASQKTSSRAERAIQPNSWAQNEIRQRIIDAPNNPHAQKKHDLLEERTAGFKTAEEGGDFGATSSVNASGFSGGEQFGSGAASSRGGSGFLEQQQQPLQTQSSSILPQSQGWSGGLDSDISSQGLSGQSVQSGGFQGLSGGGSQGFSSQPLQASWSGTDIPLSGGQQGLQSGDVQDFGIGSLDNQRWQPPLPPRQY